jgi:hypothetical protein
MTMKPKSQPKPDTSAAVVLFGHGDGGKPRAAYFPAAHAEAAVKAASLMGLRVLNVTGPETSEVAAKLPAGRIHANGRGFVPFVRADLYAKIAALTGPRTTEPAAAEPATTSAGSDHQRAVGGSSAALTVPGIDAARLPQSWDDIGVGSVVIAGSPESDTELVYWEAIVTEQNDDMFTVRWRHYPRERKIARHRLNLARMCPAAKVDAAAASTTQGSEAKPAKPPADKEQRPKAEGPTDRYPADWCSLDVGHLVIAKEDGPWQSWWEGVVAKVDGDVLRIEWRKHPDLPPIVRHRAQVALLPPKPAAHA